jgi:hypothetical protein
MNYVRLISRQTGTSTVDRYIAVAYFSDPTEAPVVMPALVCNNTLSQEVRNPS